MWLSFLLITVVTNISFTDAFNYLIPENREVIYKWKADIRAGTYLPRNYASLFALEGEVHVQKLNGSIFVKIANLTHKSYNGVMNHVRENEKGYFFIPEQVRDLESVFEIYYNDDGLVDNVGVRNGEEEFSKNIKKAIGSVFQLEASVLRREFTTSESLTFEENSIYGREKINYIVYPRNDSIEVQKIQDMSKATYSSIDLVSNGEFDSCDGNSEELVNHDSRKTYIVCKIDNAVKNITTSSTVIYAPFKAKSDAQYLEVSQNFQLIDIVDITEKYNIEFESVSSDLTYNATLFKLQNRDKLIPLVKDILEEISHYFDKNHINCEPNFKNGQLINRAQRLMSELNSEELLILQKTLQPNLQLIFYELLPLIDTDASILLIRDLIINKTESDLISIKLLQDMGDNSRQLINILDKLEDLIYLNDTYSWEIRKVAILRFGTIIHKSYLYLKNKRQQNIEQLYGKYITKFIDKFKTSDDSRTNRVYILALRNTKLPLYKYLSPAFNGEWWQDDNLRYLSLWAAASSPCDSDTAFRHLWPIFSNREEKTDLRILAFLYLIQARPNDSKLKMISSYMLTERDEEVYRFYYTYFQSLAQSKETCLEKIRIQAAQVLKFSPPPKYGLSSASFFDYTDINYGFGTTFENYFIKTNVSRVYNMLIKTQQFSKYQEEYSLYLKLYSNKDKSFSLTGTVADTFFLALENEFTKSLDADNFLEGAILRKGQIIDTFFLNKTDIGKLYMLVQVLTNSLTGFEMIRSNYLQYHRATVPTELGIPASWEFLMPIFYKNKFMTGIKYRKSAMDFIIDNKFSASIHYQHGLSFYNPVDNVWQGINRYQYFDANLPLDVVVSYSPIPQTLNLTWGPPRETTGVRSYVKQMVFTRDSNYQEEYQTVTLGENFRHNHTLIEEDDSNTGLKFYLGAYDSSIGVSAGSFQRKIQLFGLPYTKQFHSLSQYFLLTGGNLLRYFLLLPQAGTYGIVAKVEPSRKYPVTNTQVSLKYSLNVDKSISYLPEINLDLIISYNVKNKEENLHALIIDGNVNFGAGHRGGSVRMKVNKAVPGGKQYEFCLDATKRYEQTEVLGNIRLSLGENCSNESTIEITEVAEPSREQKDGNYTYRKCQYVVPYSWSNYYPLDCLTDLTTLRRYIYNITTNNLPKNLQEETKNWWNYFKNYFSSYFYQSSVVDDNSTRIEMTFPLQTVNEEVNFEVTTCGKNFQFSGIPSTFLTWFGFYPKSTVYPKLFLLTQKFGLNDQWIIYGDRQVRNGQIIETPVPKEWVLIPEDLAVSETKLYVRNIGENRLSFKIKSNNRTLEVDPDFATATSVEGDVLLLEGENPEDWFYYRIMRSDIGNTFVAFLPENGIHLEYYVDRLELSISKLSDYL